MNIYLEIFGYIGTALVIVSMMMTSVLKLRIINMCGGLISLIYAICIPTWPVVVLNACLISINFVQTVRQLKKKEAVTLIPAGENDATLTHLVNIWKADFEKCNPDCNLEEIREGKTHILYVGERAVGISIAANGGEERDANILYLKPAYRTAVMQAQVTELLAKHI